MSWIILYWWEWILSGMSLFVALLIISGSTHGTSNLRHGSSLPLLSLRMFCQPSSLQKSTKRDSGSSCLHTFLVSQITGAHKGLPILVNFVASERTSLLLNWKPRSRGSKMVFQLESCSFNYSVFFILSFPSVYSFFFELVYKYCT